MPTHKQTNEVETVLRQKLRARQVETFSPEVIALAELFRGHQARRIEVQAYSKRTNSKTVVTQKGGAHLKDYSRHLRGQSVKNALGVYPGFTDDPPGSKAKWLVGFIAIDLDHCSECQRDEFLFEIMQYDLIPYFTTGTTGRGNHVYLLIDGTMSQPEACAVAEKLAELARSVGITSIEIFPSNRYSSGKAIFLPFRGASKDGFGKNPLCTIESRPLSLRDPEKIHRNDPEQLRALLSEPSTPKTIQTALRPPQGNAEERWVLELERLRFHWTPGQRNHLSVGASAYGVLLGIEPTRVREELLEIVQTANDDVDERRRVINRTLLRYGQWCGGDIRKRVAFKSYYAQTDLPAPSAGGAAATIAPQVAQLRHAFGEQQRIKGRRADVYNTLLGFAERFGVEDGDHIIVSVSRRDLALQAHCALETVETALVQLEAEGLVTKGKPPKPGLAGVLLLPRPQQKDAKTDILSIPLTAGASVPEFKAYLQAVPLLEQQILTVLHHQPLRRKKLAKLVHRPPGQLSRPITRLLERGLIVKVGQEYSVAPNANERLQEMMKATTNKRRHQYGLDRERQQAWLSNAKNFRTAIVVPGSTSTSVPARVLVDPSDMVAVLMAAAQNPQQYDHLLKRYSNQANFDRDGGVITQDALVGVLVEAMKTKKLLTMPVQKERRQRPIFDPAPPVVRDRDAAPATTKPGAYRKRPSKQSFVSFVDELKTGQNAGTEYEI